MADYNSGDPGNDPNPPRPTNGNTGNGAASYGNGGPTQPGMAGYAGQQTYAQQPYGQQSYGQQPYGGQGQSRSGQSQGGHSNGSSSQAMDNTADGLVQILARQWYVIVLTAIAALMLSVLYLLVTKPIYTSVSTLKVAPLDTSSITNSQSNSTGQVDSDFLETECITIRSEAVLALAIDKIRDTRTLSGMAHPIDYLLTHVQADPAKVGRAIDVSFDSQYRDEANLIVGSIVDAYQAYESRTWEEHTKKVIDTITAGSQEQRDQLVKIQEALSKLARDNGFKPDMDPEKTPQAMEVLSLREELEKAKLETLRAHNAYAQASKAIVGNDALLKAVDEQEQHSTYSTTPQDDLKKFQDTLAIEQAKLADDSQRFGANNPVIVTDQSRVNDMIVRTVVASKEWEESTLAVQDAIEKSLAIASRNESAIVDAQKEYIQLRAEEGRLQQMSATLDERGAGVKMIEKASALNIQVLNPAQISGEPKPLKVRTLAIGMVLGVIAGLGFACVRDWTDDRMRTPQAVRQTMAAPMLGAIPAITTAYTAADRGQIVHHEPFGTAAESYRTLRTALYFGLPATTKTMLITSPVSGDGKSTFVSNLGIAMAQSGKRVLIIDADFRAPMQHRIFALKDRVGFASVLDGHDTIDQAIQRTEIDGLDVLPCGPVPSNPAEMLNSPGFTEHLQDLADKYEMVLLDSPPVTAVADARILAACADVSLMVVRIDNATRKQAEAARDGLRSVGARLIGVAVNGVNRSRAGHFGGASGYYQTGSNTLPGFERKVRRPGYGESPVAGDPGRRV